MRKTLPKECKKCGSAFLADLREHNRGYAHYCGKACAAAHLQEVREWKKANKFPNSVCAFCGTTFYRSPSKQAKSKSGFTFCNRACKEAAQRSDSRVRIKEILPDHYGTGASKYRNRAFDTYPAKCACCGYDDFKEILQVHHIDRNRENGSLENLTILCIRCHWEDHLRHNDGPFSSTRGLV